MKKIIAALAIATLTTAPAGAQTSAAARAQQLQKLEEDLNSPDPNLRLAAFEVAMESGSPAIKSKARRLGLASQDIDLKSLALRYAICEGSEFSIFAVQGKDVNVYGRPNSNSLMFGRDSVLLQLSMKDCDVTSGRFSLQKRYAFHDDSIGSVRGVSVSFNFVANVGSGQPHCTYSGSLTGNAAPAVIGVLRCVDRGDGDSYMSELAQFNI